MNTQIIGAILLFGLLAGAIYFDNANVTAFDIYSKEAIVIVNESNENPLFSVAPQKPLIKDTCNTKTGSGMPAEVYFTDSKGIAIDCTKYQIIASKVGTYYGSVIAGGNDICNLHQLTPGVTYQFIVKDFKTKKTWAAGQATLLPCQTAYTVRLGGFPTTRC